MNFSNEELSLRNRLKFLSEDLHSIFLGMVEDIGPLLANTENIFPEYTRHDVSHTTKLEIIAARALTPTVLQNMTAHDLFALLCSLWLHDSAMGDYAPLRDRYQTSHSFISKLQAYERLGLTKEECWRDYLRDKHHEIAVEITNIFLISRTTSELVHWIGKICKSHGEKEIHDTLLWPKTFAVDDNATISPPLIASILRIADILHFNRNRAPDFLLEHRRVSNILSLQHWRAHQVSVDITIEDDVCFLDGVTTDDEAYWFAQQFIDAMDDELSYCKMHVFPRLQPVLQNPLTFSRVENRIQPSGFLVEGQPVILKVNTGKLLEDLLSSALYSNKPLWFRELVQNAFDACRDLVTIKKEAQPSVEITVDNAESYVIFRDTGIGMKRHTVEDFLLVAGASYWSSSEYKAQRSQTCGHVGKFGIGFLSVFSIAEEVTVLTRHLDENDGWEFYIRDPNRVVKVRSVEKANTGTEIRVKADPIKLAAFDIEKTYDDLCSYPEYPIRLVVDGAVSREASSATRPSSDDGVITLTAVGQPIVESKLLAVDIISEGIVGSYHLPKIHIKILEANIPVLSRFLEGAGWHFQYGSNTWFGGIKYPPFHALNERIGFVHLPSAGCLRMYVSPNHYPLEMNLSREQFVTGEATMNLFNSVCVILDKALADDLVSELYGKTDPLVRSTIAALYSESLMSNWLGQTYGLSFIVEANVAPFNDVAQSPWPHLTDLMMKEIRFGCLDINGKVHYYSIKELLDEKATVFAIGAVPRHGISKELVETVLAFDSTAKLLTVLPEYDFGIMELRHWANEEILLPVQSHCRTVYGLRFKDYAKPYPHFPRECDHLGLSVASGPSNYAVLNFRDFMAESKARPTGGSHIVGVLNRNHSKSGLLIKALAKFGNRSDILKAIGRQYYNLRESMRLGNYEQYSVDNRTRLMTVLNDTINALRKGGQAIDVEEPFTFDDFAPYFDAGQVVPFGRFRVGDLLNKCQQQLAAFEKNYLRLS